MPMLKTCPVAARASAPYTAVTAWSASLPTALICAIASGSFQRRFVTARVRLSSMPTLPKSRRRFLPTRFCVRQTIRSSPQLKACQFILYSPFRNDPDVFVGKTEVTFMMFVCFFSACYTRVLLNVCLLLFLSAQSPQLNLKGTEGSDSEPWNLNRCRGGFLFDESLFV